MKVLLIDDHPLILSALQAVIQGLNDETTVVTAESARAARAILKADAEIDLVLLDLRLGDSDGFSLLSELRKTYPSLPVVVISASDRNSDVIRAVDLGAMGFVPKRSSNAMLFEALTMVMSGGIYVPPMTLGGEPAASEGDTVPGVLHRGDDSPPDSGFHSGAVPFADLGLTRRQTDVLALLLKGLPNKLIARELKVSVETVKDHVAAVLRTLGVSSRTQAVLAVSQMSGQTGITGRRRVDR